MALHTLRFLENKLSRLEGADLEIRPENSSELEQIKGLLGQGLHAKLLS